MLTRAAAKLQQAKQHIQYTELVRDLLAIVAVD